MAVGWLIAFKWQEFRNRGASPEGPERVNVWAADMRRAGDVRRERCGGLLHGPR